METSTSNRSDQIKLVAFMPNNNNLFMWVRRSHWNIADKTNFSMEQEIKENNLVQEILVEQSIRKITDSEPKRIGLGQKFRKMIEDPHRDTRTCKLVNSSSDYSDICFISDI